MKHPAFSFQTLVGGETAVLQAFIDQGQKMPPALAMTVCRNLTERMSKKAVIDLIEPQLRDLYDMFCLTHGRFDDLAEDDQDAWTDELDTEIETFLDSYSNSITQDFIGKSCIDTRLHREVQSGPDEVSLLTTAFANDVWRQLIYYYDAENEVGKEKTTGQILSAVGIVKDDLIEVLADMPDPTPEQKAAKEKQHMRSMNEIFNKVHDHYDGTFEDKEVRDLFEMASDSDAILSSGGATMLGLEADDAGTLRMFAQQYGKGAPEEFITGLKGAPYEEDATDSAGDVVLETLDEDAEMAALMGGSLPAAAPSVPSIPAGATSPPPSPPAASTGSAAPGAIDKNAFVLIRKYVKIKDEDLAAGIGVSRQTLVNYADPSKKTQLVASAEQKQYLINVVQEHLDGLNDALALLS